MTLMPFCGKIFEISYIFKYEWRDKMREKVFYSPAEVEVIKISTGDVIVTSPPLDNSGNIPSDTWS